MEFSDIIPGKLISVTFLIIVCFNLEKSNLVIIRFIETNSNSIKIIKINLTNKNL